MHGRRTHNHKTAKPAHWRPGLVALLAALAPLLHPTAARALECPRVVGGWPIAALEDVVMRGSIGYACASWGVITVAMDESGELQYLGSILVPCSAIDVEGDTLVVVSSWPALTVSAIDVNDPARPRLRSQREAPAAFCGSGASQAGVNDVNLVQGIAYVDHDQALSIFAVEGYDWPWYLGCHNTGADQSVVDGTLMIRAGAGSDEALQVLDVSQPSNPVVLGTAPSENAYAIAFDHGYAFVVVWSRLRIYDVRTPSQPEEVSSIVTTDRRAVGTAWPYLMYVGNETLWTFGVWDPSRPVLLHQLELGDWLTAAFDGPRAIAWNNHTFMALQVEDPLDPAIGASLPLVPITRSTAVTDDAVYLGHMGGGITAFDLRGPSGPVPVSSLPLQEVTDLRVQGDLLLAGDSESDTITVYDLSDPFTPTPLATIGVGFSRFSSRGNHVYTVWPLTVIDVGDPQDPTVVAILPDSNQWHYIAAGDGFAVVASETTDSYRVIDVQAPSAPFVVTQFGLGSPSRGLGVSDRLLAVGHPGWDIQLVDLSDLLHPAVVAEIQLPGSIRSVHLDDGILTAAWSNLSDSGFDLYDVVDPSSPTRLLRSDIGLGYSPVDRHGDRVVSGGSGDGPLWVLDVGCVLSLIFNDDFESGDLGSWQGVVP